MASIDSDDELDYLAPSFDPSSLTVPRLRSILVSHDIQYPASAKKAQLVTIFTAELVPRSRRILAARSRTRRTSKGITDMPSSQEGTVDGDDQDTGLMPPPSLPDSRRKSRRSPRTQAAGSSEDALKPKSTSRGRNSSSKHPRASDSDVTPEIDSKRPLVRKTRKSDVTPTTQVEEPVRPALRPRSTESTFSNENPFQSGSSPLDPIENRRKSAGVKSEKRKSSSRRRITEGVTTNKPVQVKQEDDIVVPSSKTFDIPLTRFRGPTVEEDSKTQLEAGEEFTPEAQLELVRERAANGEVDILPPRKIKRAKSVTRVSRSAPWVIIMTLFTGYAAWWRREKIEVGYCGIGKASRSLANLHVPEWTSILEPECEPCPQHAICFADMQAQCEQDFILRPHPLTIGGLIPLPPTCEPDGEKARKVKAVTDRAVEELRERRAKWECGTLVDEDGKQAAAVEIDEVDLKREVSQKRRKGMSSMEFEDLWKGALGEIMGRDEVISDVDGLVPFSILHLEP